MDFPCVPYENSIYSSAELSPVKKNFIFLSQFSIMNKTIVLTIGLLLASIAVGAQTLGEKYKLPEETSELRTDGVYHLPASLLADDKINVEAYFRFYPDGTFIIYHSRVSPETKPEVFQANCNFDFVSSTDAPFNKDYTLKSKEHISRARIVYPDKAILLELDSRKDVISATIRTFNPDGQMIGKPANYVMPFHQITWPVSSTVIKK